MFLLSFCFSCPPPSLGYSIDETPAGLSERDQSRPSGLTQPHSPPQAGALALGTYVPSPSHTAATVPSRADRR